MNPNELYQTIFNDDRQELRDIRSRFMREANDMFKSRYVAEQKRRQPRRKNPDPLDDEFTNQLRARLLEEWAIINELDALIQAFDAQKNSLDYLASQVVVEPSQAYHRLKSSFVSTYRSQGYGEHRYAKNALCPLAESLELAGFETHISYVESWDGYCLWANCEPWVADAISRRTKFQDTLDSLVRNGLNPKVIYPMLPYERINWNPGPRSGIKV